MASAPQEREGPPIFSVPSQPVVCVEHPCIIKNLDRGISSLGGDFALNKLFENGNNPDTFEASLRPEDVMAKTILSRKVDVKHLLVKVTVPKRTGRKRKRGTDGPFLADTPSDGAAESYSSPVSNQLKATNMLRTLRDNEDIASVEVVGKIGQTHRFRSMPDFQYATTPNSLMQNLRGSLFTTNLPSIRDFNYDMSKTLAPGQDVGPPPFFTVVKQPFNYSYKQNPYVKVYRDAEGNIKVANTTAPIKHIRHNIEPEAPEVPTGLPAELAPLDTMPPKIQQAVQQLRLMFEDRPLMQRRVFINRFKGRQSENELKAAVGYCGYAFTSGPWRDTVIKFGIDPRKDPQYRIYQTVTYQLMDEGRSAVDDPGSYIKKVGGRRVSARVPKVEHSHVFDGKKFYKDGKVWQACDVTDPMLKELLDNAELRTEADMVFSGWYGNGTWSLFRRIMKYKIQTLAAGRLPDDDMCRAVAAMFPPFVDETNVHLTRIDEPGSFLSRSAYADYVIEGEASTLASEVRATAMAAHRYRNKQYRGRTRRESTASTVSRMSVDITHAETRANVKAAMQVPASPAAEESDAALIGLESDGEEEQDDSDGEGIDAIDDEA